jgi:hypothetical protein
VGVRRVPVRRVPVRKVPVRRVPVPWIVAVRSVAVEEELAAAGCAHVRGAGGAFGFGVGGGFGGGLLGCAELSHRAAQTQEEQQALVEMRHFLFCYCNYDGNPNSENVSAKNRYDVILLESGSPSASRNAKHPPPAVS